MKILRTIINIVLISIIAVCAYKIYDKSAEYKKADKKISLFICFLCNTFPVTDRWSASVCPEYRIQGLTPWQPHMPAPYR